MRAPVELNITDVTDDLLFGLDDPHNVHVHRMEKPDRGSSRKEQLIVFEELIASVELKTRRYGSRVYLVSGRDAETEVAARLRRTKARRGGSQ